MLQRRIESLILKHLKQFPAVGILGPRQCGKTTIAKKIMKSKKKASTYYYDLESPADRNKFYDPELLFLNTKEDFIIDEVQRMPDLFPILRSVIDKNRKKGKYLLLGSAALDFVKGSSETLAGRIMFIEAHPFNLTELKQQSTTLKKHWLRGGFPDAWKARTDADVFTWHDGFMKTFVERDLNNMFDTSISSQLMFRMWRMIAHYHAQILNIDALSKSLDVSHSTINKYLDFLEASYMIRRLSSYHISTKKRLVKSPKIYIRDSGIFHYLNDINSSRQLHNHALVGYSFEGYVVEQIIQLLPNNIKAFFYRTQDGAEVDLILVKGVKAIATIEIKYSLSPSISRGLTESINDLACKNNFIITPSNEEIYLLKRNISVVGLQYFLNKILPKITKNA